LPLKADGINVRRGFIVELTDKYGRVAYGEASPLPSFSVESLEQAGRVLYSQLHCLVSEKGKQSQINFFSSGASPSASFAIESALWGLSVKHWLPSPKLAPLLLGDVDCIRQRLREWKGGWPSEFKMKVARGAVVDDVKRVIAVFKLLPESVSIRLDANQKWTLSEALEFSYRLLTQAGTNGYGVLKKIAYIEEPTANIAEFPGFYRETGIGYALDESIQHCRTVNTLGYKGLKAVVIKPTLIGGLHDCRQLTNGLLLAGIRVILSSSFESIIGIHCLAQLSAHWFPGEMPGLDTLSAFVENIIEEMPESGYPLPEAALNKLELVWEEEQT